MRWLKALGGLTALIVMVVGPPAALAAFVGNPYPPGGFALDVVTPREIIGFLAAIGWLLWAQLMLCVLAEVISVISGREFHIPGTLSFQRGLARRLVGACVVVSASAPVLLGGAANAAAPAHVPHAPVAVAHQVAGQQTQSPRQQQGTITVTVKPYDTLMGIAEHHLGSINEWKTIASLNEGRVMNDGTVFRSADQIRPGWELMLPGSAHAGGQHTVAAGESLSQIAQDDLGSANQWPALYDANKAVIGSDPNLILPGQELEIPNVDDTAASAVQGRHVEVPHASSPQVGVPSARTEAKPAAPAEQSKVAHEPAAPPVAPTPGESVPTPGEPPASQGAALTVMPSGQAHAETAPAAAAEVAPDSSTDSGWPIRTIGGVCSILAAAVVGLLAARRSRQQRRRPPGVRIPLPSAEAELVEQEVRQVADPIGLETVDLALRTLVVSAGFTPGLRAVRMVGEQLDVYLTDPVALGAPWVAGDDTGHTWFLSADAAAAFNVDDDTAQASYPALVSIGHDEEGAVVLVNLADTGGLGLTGDVDLTGEAFTAMVLEMSTLPWAAGADLTVVGTMAELSDELRFRYVPVFVPSPEHGLLVSYRNQQDPGQRIVATRSELDQARLQALQEYDVAVVAEGTAINGWALEISDRDHAVLKPLGIEITPQLIDQRTYAGLLESLSVAMIDPRSITEEEQGSLVVPFGEMGEGPDHHQVSDELTDVDVQVDKLEAKGDVPLEAGSAPALQLAEPVDQADGKTEAEAAATPAEMQAVSDVDQEAVTPVAVLPSALATGHPVIRILGEHVEIVGLAGEAPASESHRGVCTRIATYWALNPGASRDSMIHAVWGGKLMSPSTVDPRVANTRKWFGANPETGVEYLPPRKTTFADEVTTDWAIFNQLVGKDPATASTDHLEQALDLVTGRPFAGEGAKDYAFTEFLRMDIDNAIADVAYQLGRRRYFEGAWRKATAAVSAGVRIEPGNEYLWRLQLHIANSEGRHGVVAETVARMEEAIKTVTDGYLDLDPETVDLVNALKTQDAATLEHHREAL